MRTPDIEGAPIHDDPESGTVGLTVDLALV